MLDRLGIRPRGDKGTEDMIHLAGVMRRPCTLRGTEFQLSDDLEGHSNFPRQMLKKSSPRMGRTTAQASDKNICINEISHGSLGVEGWYARRHRTRRCHKQRITDGAKGGEPLGGISSCRPHIRSDREMPELFHRPFRQRLATACCKLVQPKF